MANIRGYKEFQKFKAGAKLTRTEAMKAQCYECNGEEESAEDCGGKSCPMYQYRLYAHKKAKVSS